MGKTDLLILDVDGTLFSWADYFIPSFRSSLRFIEEKIDVPYSILCAEAQSVFLKRGSVEYPFAWQSFPSIQDHYNYNVEQILNDCAEPARRNFNSVAYSHLKPFEGVVETLGIIRKNHPDLKIVALTDAPCYIALWKLNKMGLLHFFDSVYGLQDPKLPTLNGQILATQEILLKHIERHKFGFRGDIRILPDEYAKPDVKGLKMILIDYDIEDSHKKEDILFVGDNLQKDVELGNRLNITSVWAKYGANVSDDLLEILAQFAPDAFVHRNISGRGTERPEPDHTIITFDQILKLIN